jgi:hypothetical protein
MLPGGRRFLQVGHRRASGVALGTGSVLAMCYEKAQKPTTEYPINTNRATKANRTTFTFNLRVFLSYDCGQLISA